MKKFILLILAVIAYVAPAFADLGADGYYRVHNYDTGRYIYVYDNHGELDYTATRVDLYAIQLWQGIDRAVSDPASVVYIEKHGTQYDFKTQGTGIYKMISSYVNIRPDSKRPGTYFAYGAKAGLTKYLCDGSDDPTEAQSWMIGECTDLRNWYITPVSASSDNYFGVKPTVKASGASYAALYADFSFSFSSKGMKAYYVKSFDSKRGLAVWEEITTGVANSVPVIIRCNSDKPSDNRLNLGASAVAKPSGNKLTGVYFNYDAAYGHINRVAYDKSTMRVLGVTSDGSIGLVTSNIKYVDRNSFYMKVPAGSAEQFKLVTQAEYDNIVANEPPEVTSITLDKKSAELYINETLQLTATVLPAEAAAKVPVTWKSSNTKVATVNADGLVTTTGFGTATITATCGEKSSTCKITVAPKVTSVVTLDKTSIRVSKGYTAQLSATAVVDEAYDKTIVWTSADTKIATVDSEGLVKGIAIGETTVTATCGGTSAKCTVTVTEVMATEIVLNETEVELTMGQNTMLTATVLPEDAVDKTVTWSSSDPKIADVNNRGRVTAAAVGTVDIIATCGEVQAVCKVTVKGILATSLMLNRTTLKMKKGDTQALTVSIMPFNVTDKTVTWTSSDEAVATVSPDGVVTAVGGGDAVIKAYCPDATAECKVTVEKTKATAITLSESTITLTVGDEKALSATVKPDDADNKTVAWTSRDESVATVDADGNIQAVGVGTTVVTAECDGVKAQCSVTVNPVKATEIVLSQTEIELVAGEKAELEATVKPDEATDKSVTWKSSDSSVATVNASGQVTAVGVGTAVITASCGDVQAECKVTVKPVNATAIELDFTDIRLAQGDVFELHASVTPDNTTDKTVAWQSSDMSIVTITEDGVLTCVGIGTAVITASCGDVKAECKVTVEAVKASYIMLSSTALEITEDETVQLSATVYPEDTLDKTITWTSSNPSVATVDSEGRVTAVGVGTAVITAFCPYAESECVITVREKEIGGGEIYASSIELNKTELEMTEDDTFELKATVLPAEAYDKTVVWTSSDTEVVTVNEEGVVTAVGAGTAVITASCTYAEAECKVTVKEKDGITDIVIDGNNEFDVYNINGVLVKSKAKDLNGLPAGIYIVNGVKVLID